MDIATRLNAIKAALPPSVTLIAVSKTKPIESIEEAYAAGHRDFGENYVQELVDKYERLPKDIRWHFIGHLQSNKIKYLVPFVYLIHGIDRLSLLHEVNKQALKQGRVQACLLQVHIAQEESKFGFSVAELLDAVQHNSFANWSQVRVMGLMAMASNTNAIQQLKNEFLQLQHVFETLKGYQHPNFNMQHLSAGMSNDYTLAIEHGSTLIRIGSSIFGERQYKQ